MDDLARVHAEVPDDSGLTPASLIRLDYVPAPADIAHHVMTFFRIRCAEPLIRDFQPAALGQIYVYLAGDGHMQFADGRTEAGHPVTLMTPLCKAASFEVVGPLDVFGAALSPLGWAALTGIDVSGAGDCLIDATAVLGADAGALGLRVREIAEGDAGGNEANEGMRDAMSAFLRERFRPLPARHVALVQAVVEWLGSDLSPHVDDLYARTGYSPRQAQRLAARYFGMSPVHLVRKYRATRVAAMLAQPDIDDATVGMLTDQFYDQSHMIREMREFIGRTPKRLGAGDAPILDAVVNVRNFYEIKTPG